LRIKGLKEKRDFFPPPRRIVGVFLTSQVQGDPSFRHRKEEFKVKKFERLHGSLSFEDLENFQFQELLKIGCVVVA